MGNVTFGIFVWALSRVLGSEFLAPFEMYVVLALASAEYEEIGEMRSGKGASTYQVMIFVRSERATHLMEGDVGRGNT